MDATKVDDDHGGWPVGICRNLEWLGNGIPHGSAFDHLKALS
jgi:hypothetical protein